jgi:hypothetical protein
MKATTPWITYRTRFLVKATQLTTSLAFTDVLGRQHSGRKGDYLVESSDGVLRIASRQIFEDIYVPLLADQAPADRPISLPHETSPAHQSPPDSPTAYPLPTRKLPQPERNRRNVIPGLRSL